MPRPPSRGCHARQVGQVEALSVEGRLHGVSLLVLLAAAGLLLSAARPPASGRRLSWVYPNAVICASLSSLAIMVIDVTLVDPLAAATCGVAVIVLAVAGRRRYAVVVARRDAAHDLLRHARTRRHRRPLG